MRADPTASALFLGAFFDELERWGVHDVVVSPGSRSTPLAMTAYELSRRFPDRLRLFVDVDERGAAFFALGLAKASGQPAAVICTSGTAVANYYPAVLEAESSRVPLIVLTGDRPARLQGLGAPQTCDQLNAYGSHVRAFRNMPEPAADAAAIAFARQAAREARIAAGGEAAGRATDGEGAPRIAGACLGGPVHFNFPFDEPLKPDLRVEGLFETGRSALNAPSDLRLIHPSTYLDPMDSARVLELLRGRRVLVAAGEGSCLFAANSMSVRALDTFYAKGGRRLAVLCNRGLNGIDGTVSTALGAAQHFEQTTLLTGDLTLLHDLNALALQRELRVQRASGGPDRSIVIVLLNNNGGGIFDMLPQRSEDAYFERLFLTPQDVEFGAAAQAFGVPHRLVETVAEFDAAYDEALGVPGISLVEVRVPLEGLPERYAPYWS